MSEKIFVTKSFLASFEEYSAYVKKIFDNCSLTNQGPLLQELESKLKKYLNVEYFHFVTNGTISLQLSLKALDITEGEIITTPFSYVATITSILWERCDPVFVDIEPQSFCINPDKIEEAITARTKAILAVHVFGYSCAVEKIEQIAKKHNIKVIYDAAHTFGAKYKGKSLVAYGDVATLSFHATKVFHTIEGGAVVVNDKALNDKLELLKRFGHNGDDYYSIGINAKASEFQAAMGLTNFPYIDDIIKARKHASELYDELLSGVLRRPKAVAELEYNYAYYPVIFDSEKALLKAFEALKKNDVIPRRYFYPSLNTLPYLKITQPCPISEDIALKVLCLPLSADISDNNIERIVKLIKYI